MHLFEGGFKNGYQWRMSKDPGSCVPAPKILPWRLYQVSRLAISTLTCPSTFDGRGTSRVVLWNEGGSRKERVGGLFNRGSITSSILWFGKVHPSPGCLPQDNDVRLTQLRLVSPYQKARLQLRQKHWHHGATTSNYPVSSVLLLTALVPQHNTTQHNTTHIRTASELHQNCMSSASAVHQNCIKSASELHNNRIKAATHLQLLCCVMLCCVVLCCVVLCCVSSAVSSASELHQQCVRTTSELHQECLRTASAVH